jgi:hypothetical protein
MLIHWQNSYMPCRKQCASHHEAHSQGTGQQSKNTSCTSEMLANFHCRTMQNKNTATDLYISNLNITVVKWLSSKKTGIVKLLTYTHAHF